MKVKLCSCCVAESATQNRYHNRRVSVFHGDNGRSKNCIEIAHKKWCQKNNAVCGDVTICELKQGNKVGGIVAEHSR